MLSGLNPVDLLVGASYPLRGLRILRQQPGLARFWLFPILITSVSMLVSVVLAVEYHDQWLARFWALPVQQGALGTVLLAAYWLARVLVLLVSSALFLVVCVACSTVVAAPFNDALSAAVERRVRGEVAQGAFFRDLLRTLGLELFKLLLYLAVMGPLWLMSWLLPGPGQVVYLAFAGIFSISYVALDYIDWPAARRGYSIRQRFRLFMKRPLLMWGFGLAAWGCLFIPLLNLAFMPLSVAGGTLLFLDLERDAAGT